MITTHPAALGLLATILADPADDAPRLATLKNIGIFMRFERLKYSEPAGAGNTTSALTKTHPFSRKGHVMATNNLADYWDAATRNPGEISPEDIAAIRQTFQVASEVRPIPSAPGYAVSECGRVFTAMPCSWKKGDRLRERKQITHMHGYRAVALQVNKVRRLDTVHRLVAEAFLPPPQEGQNVVRHLNGDPADNRAVNLAWGTPADNMADCIRHGRTLKGLKNPGAKLTPKRVEIVRALIGEGFSQSAVAAFMGVHPETIRLAVSGDQWGGSDAAS